MKHTTMYLTGVCEFIFSFDFGLKQYWNVLTSSCALHVLTSSCAFYLLEDGI